MNFELSVASKLLAVGLIELDEHDDVLFSWQYPDIEDSLRELITGISHIKKTNDPGFLFTKYQDTFVYILNTIVDSENTKLNGLKKFSIILNTTEFNPEKYQSLAQILSLSYAASASPVQILEPFLKVFLSGKADCGEHGKFNEESWDYRQAYLASPLGDIIELFGAEDVVTLWSALLTKKRVLVYSSNVVELLKIVRALPLLVFHRQNWDVLRPLVDLEDKIAREELVTAANYVCGVTDSNAEHSTELYDVFVDVSARKIKIADHASKSLAPTQFHSSLADTLSEAHEKSLEVEGPQADQLLIKLLLSKTKALLAKLNSLSDEGEKLKPEDLNQPELLPLRRFLWDVAVAEAVASVE